MTNDPLFLLQIKFQARKEDEYKMQSNILTISENDPVHHDMMATIISNREKGTTLKILVANW